VSAAAAHIGHRVQLLEDKDGNAPPGVWRCVDRSPRGTGHWWLQPADPAARAWAAGHPRNVTQGCISWPSRLMESPQLYLPGT
jgi:hypothetical protein